MRSASAGNGQQALLVEAFAAGPLQGNGAAVVLLEAPAEAAWMQALATSLQQSETAFLWQREQHDWALRWFTPSCEVPLCGHATLAATLALGHWGLLQPGAGLQLASRSGPLEVRLAADHPDAASLVLPSSPLQPLSPPPYLEALLQQPLQGYWGSALGYRVALLPEQVDLEGLPSPATQLQGADRQGLVLMQALAPGAVMLFGEACDYQLRFFAPGLGIEEDPVTGSAHALVAPWWMQRFGRERVLGWQCSPRHGGMLCERLQADRIRLSGTGHRLWNGQLQAGPCGRDPDGWRVCVAS